MGTLVFLVVCLAAGLAQAQTGNHGDGHHGMHFWYETLKQPGSKAPCCNYGDCRPARTRFVGADRMTVEVWIEGEWHRVPPDKILPKTAPDLQSHVCAPPWNKPIGISGHQVTYRKGEIFCLILGEGV